MKRTKQREVTVHSCYRCVIKPTPEICPLDKGECLCYSYKFQLEKCQAE